MTGDLNEVQTLALLSLIRRENEEFADIEWERFKRMMIAVHPEKAKEIMEALADDTDPEAEFAPELTDEELEAAADYRLSGAEVENTIAALREFGLAVD